MRRPRRHAAAPPRTPGSCWPAPSPACRAAARATRPATGLKKIRCTPEDTRKLLASAVSSLSGCRAGHPTCHRANPNQVQPRGHQEAVGQRRLQLAGLPRGPPDLQAGQSTQVQPSLPGCRTDPPLCTLVLRVWLPEVFSYPPPNLQCICKMTVRPWVLLNAYLKLYRGVLQIGALV